MIVEKAMHFAYVRTAALGAVLLAAMASTGAGQQASTAQPAIIRFTDGVIFEVPQGWSWSELSHHSGANSVKISYDATRPQDKSKYNPNQLTVHLRRGAPTESKNWTRVDLDRSQTLTNGVVARWKSGRQWDAHAVFSGSAAIGPKSLGFIFVDGQTQTFDRALLEGALLKIAGSMREVPPSNAIFHPAAGFAVGREFKNWNATVLPASVGLRCGVCGTDSRVWIYVYPAKKSFSDLSAALADVTGFFVKQDNAKAGEPRRASLTGGEILWTEQPGSAWPVAGVLARDGRMFFVNMTGRLPNSLTPEALRADYLAVAQTVRPWDGR